MRKRSLTSISEASFQPGTTVDIETKVQKYHKITLLKSSYCHGCAKMRQISMSLLVGKIIYSGHLFFSEMKVAT